MEFGYNIIILLLLCIQELGWQLSLRTSMNFLVWIQKIQSKPKLFISY